MDERYEIFATDSDGSWHVSKEVFDAIKEALNHHCICKTDGLIDFTAETGIRICMRASLVVEMIISTKESRDNVRAASREVENERKAWEAIHKHWDDE